MVADGCGWLRKVVSGILGDFWAVVDGCGWLWVVVGHCRWLWVVACGFLGDFLGVCGWLWMRSLFNHRRRGQSNQEQCSLCFSSPCFLVLLCTHYGLLQCFSTCFCKLKEIRVLWPIFTDYVISCDYG